MSNTALTASIIAGAAVTILDNELVMAKQVFRGYEEDFGKKVNGYNVGETITIRKPTDFTVRDGATMAVQDVTEGSTTIVLNKRKGVDFKFTSQDLTTKIEDLAERVIKPAMIQLANQIDTDLMALYKTVPNWVGTPGQTVNSFADYALGPQRMDTMAIPSDGRSSVLSPADYWGMLGSQTALYINGPNKDAYRDGSLGMIGGVDTYMSQNVPVHTVGSQTGGQIDQALTTSTTTYASVKDTFVQTIHMDVLGTTKTIKAGDVFTIANVYDVNPVTKVRLPHLKMFTVTADVTSDAVTTGDADVIVTPPLIWTGAFKNIDLSTGTDLNDAVVTWIGTASTNYSQNMVFRKNAFALVTVPLIAPPGAVDVARKSYKGLNVRVIPVYDGVSDESAWRLDVLYGTKTIDPRQAVRLSGT